MRGPGGPRRGQGQPGQVVPSSGDGTVHAEPSGAPREKRSPAPRQRALGTARPATLGPQPNDRPTRGAPSGGYSSSSAYEPMARAMSAWAQNRWYVNVGAAPPSR